MPTRDPTTIGVISDTHGLLRPQARIALRDASLIVHAGDIGAPAVLEELRRLAPVIAVRGNNDTGPWASALPEVAVAEYAGIKLYVLHDIHELAIDPVAEHVDVVIAGHSHRPRIDHDAGVLFLNPGSAGPRRFSLPVTVARIRTGPRQLSPEIVHLM